MNPPRAPCSRCGGPSARAASISSSAASNQTVTVRQDLRVLLKRFGLQRFAIDVDRDGTGKMTGLRVTVPQELAQAVIDNLPRLHQGVAVVYKTEAT